jgi:hypothetical protein
MTPPVGLMDAQLFAEREALFLERSLERFRLLA